MMTAQWDMLELIMTSMARDYPEHFTLNRDGAHWHWINRPLGIDQKFTFGEVNTLPYEPMEYIGRQVQGDFSIQDQRDNQLWMDAGIITSQADWSLDFDVGMNFFEWHEQYAARTVFPVGCLGSVRVCWALVGRFTRPAAVAPGEACGGVVGLLRHGLGGPGEAGRHGGLLHRLGRPGAEPGRAVVGGLGTGPRVRTGARTRRGDVAVDAARRAVGGRQRVPATVLRAAYRVDRGQRMAAAVLRTGGRRRVHGRQRMPAALLRPAPGIRRRAVGNGEAGDVAAVGGDGPLTVAVARPGVAVGGRVRGDRAVVDATHGPRCGRQPDGAFGHTGRPRNPGLDPAGRVASAVPRRLGPPVVGELGEGHAHEGYAVPRAAVRTPKGSRASP